MAEPRPAVVECTSVRFHYKGGSAILSDIDLRIEPGVVAALMGPSGSGKSTLLAMLGGQLKPDKGIVLWRGSRSSVAMRFGWIQQSVNVFGRRTAIENVAMALFSSGLPLDEGHDRSREALRAVGLDDLRYRTTNTLSGGEAQRVVVARALLGEPDLLLADEPSGQLDKESTDSVVDALVSSVRSLSAHRSLSAVIATHDRAVAERCDVVFSLADGRVSASR